MISDYFRSIEELLNSSKLIADKNIDFKEFDIDEGMVRGKLLFLGGYVFTFMEYICKGKDRPKYRFNLSDSKGNLIFRYDNASHHKGINTYLHHKHTPAEIKPSREMGLAEVISEIEMMILNDFVK